MLIRFFIIKGSMCNLDEADARCGFPWWAYRNVLTLKTKQSTLDNWEVDSATKNRFIYDDWLKKITRCLKLQTIVRMSPFLVVWNGASALCTSWFFLVTFWVAWALIGPCDATSQCPSRRLKSDGVRGATFLTENATCVRGISFWERYPLVGGWTTPMKHMLSYACQPIIC